MKRLEVFLQRPNALFESWIENWLEDASSRDASRLHSKLSIALSSLKSYPLPLTSGKECSILRGFGSTLCNRIDEKLKLHQEETEKLLNSSKIHENEINQVAKTIKFVKEKNFRTANTAHKLQNIKILSNEIVSMLPGKFRILLIVDTQETNGKTKKYLDETRTHLNMMNVEYDVRRLMVGDFLWIARNYKTNDELILPYIVERKRMDDLASSIRDGRFGEQKHRLKCSGLPNVIYLVESVSGDNQYLGLPIDNLKQAITNTRIHDNFRVVQTENNKETVSYLQNFTRFLIQQFKDKTLVNFQNGNNLTFIDNDPAKIICLMKYQTFNITSAQNYGLNVHEIFIQQLLQLYCLSLEKALAITKVYPTPTLLLETYKRCLTPTEGRKILADVRYGQLQRKIGDKISEIIYNFYNISF